jgi:flagellar hook-associated protein 2
MTTTSSTTSTSSTATNIVNGLGYGSGIDVTALVNNLAAASRDPKVEKLDARDTANKASISAVGTVKSDLETFSKSLDAVISGGTLQTALSMSDSSVLDASTVTGSAGLGIDTSVTVNKLALAQNSLSGSYADRTSIIGSGTFTLTVGGVAKTVTVASGTGSLDDIASAINDAGTGVAARVINDGNGYRLVLRGATGTSGAFSLTSSDAGLSDVAAGMTTTQAAQNAEVVVDGVTYTRSTNKLDDVIYGVSLTIKQEGTTRLTAQDSKATYASALQDFVDAYNTLKADLTAAMTATKNDYGLRSLSQSLANLVSQTVSTGQFGSLGSIGVKTNKDGTLSYDAAAFERAYAANPDAVVAVFVPKRDATHTATTDPGIGGALAIIKNNALSTAGVLTSTSNRLTREQTDIADDRETMEDRESKYKERLQTQYANLDSKVGAYKATQSYLTQQIALWSKS